MSGLLLPSHAPADTRRAVIQCLMQVPALTRLLDTPGLLATVCLDSLKITPDARGNFLFRAASTPHRRLAQEVGMPSRPVLRRLTGDALDSANLGLLPLLFNERHSLLILRHAPYVSAPLIQAMAVESVRHHVGRSFLIDLGRTRRRDRPAPADIIEMATFLREYLPETVLQSLRHYESLWGRYGELILRHESVRRRRVPFPPPPWSDEPGYATALRSWSDLISESILMRNCTGYDDDSCKAIRAARGYFFRIEEHWGMPRATLYCVKQERHWRIGQARRWGNALVTKRHLHCLALWLAEKQALSDETLCLPATQHQTRVEF